MSNVNSSAYFTAGTKHRKAPKYYLNL